MRIGFCIPVFMLLLASVQPPRTLFRHHTYKDFAKGSFADAGGNLYVSQQGRLQFINLFDLDFDGYPEVVVNNDHNHMEAPDALVYKNTNERGLRSLFSPFPMDAPAYQNLGYTLESLHAITRLPAEGAGKSVVADLNLDGYKDLVFVNFIHGSTLAPMPAYIYWGGTDGLNPARRSLLPGDRSTAVAVDDITGDGLPDMVIANAGREHMGIETPDFSAEALAKAGSEREKTSYIFPQTEAGFTIDARQAITTSFAIDVKIADLDNDGKKEIIFLELGAPGNLRIMAQQNGIYTTKQTLPVIAPKPLFLGKRIYEELLVKDLNNDGYADIFAPSQGQQSEIFWNNKGAFAGNNKTVLETENAMSADAADLNKDGIVDLVIANYFTGKNTQPFYETNSYIWWGTNTGFNKEHRTALPTLGAVSVRLADVNNTGYTDILFAQHRNQQTLDVPNYIYLNTQGRFFPESRIDLQGFGTVNIVAEDLDGNGKKEVIVLNSMSGKAHHSGMDDAAGNEGVDKNAQPMYIYRGNAHKQYGPANVVRVPQSSAETNMAFADIDDDGKPDLLHLRGLGYRLTIRYDVYNYPATKELTEITLPHRMNSVNVADFNKDGLLDVLVTPIIGPQGMLIWGKGNHQYKTELFEFPHLAYCATVGDINNDGLLDAITSSHKEISILLGAKQGNRFYFQQPQVITTDMLTTRVSLADFNKDGWLDLWCQNLQNTYTKVYDQQSWVLVNNKGSFSLNDKRSFSTFGANGGTIAQLWKDGNLEVVASNYHADASRRVGAFVLKAGADGFPNEQHKLRLPAQSSGANMVLDFNGDGYQDILVFNHTGNDTYNGGLNPTGGTHGVGSVLYWGSAKDSFGLYDKTWLPSFGPHSRITIDPGSIARRDPFETYTSDNIVNNLGTEQFTLTINGRFNDKQYVEPVIIVGAAGAGETIVPQLISTSASTTSYSVRVPKGKTFRYRLKLHSSNTGSGPLVTSVDMKETENK
jgi:hypothetical protein